MTATDYAEDLDRVAASLGKAADERTMRMMPSCHPQGGVHVRYQRSGKLLVFHCATCEGPIGKPIAVARNPRGLN